MHSGPFYRKDAAQHLPITTAPAPCPVPKLIFSTSCWCQESLCTAEACWHWSHSRDPFFFTEEIKRKYLQERNCDFILCTAHLWKVKVREKCCLWSKYQCHHRRQLKEVQTLVPESEKPQLTYWSYDHLPLLLVWFFFLVQYMHKFPAPALAWPLPNDPS